MDLPQLPPLPPGHFRVPVIAWVVETTDGIDNFYNLNGTKRADTYATRRVTLYDPLTIMAENYGSSVDSEQVERTSSTVIPANPNTYQIFKLTDSGDELISYEISGVYTNPDFRKMMDGV